MGTLIEKKLEDSRRFFPGGTISCGPWPDNQYEMTMVEEWCGFRVGMEVEFAKFGDRGPLIRGVILAIGENAKDGRGEVFTAFAIRLDNTGIDYRTQRDIHHVN